MDVCVIGAGFSGLAVGAALRQYNAEKFVILEAGQRGNLDYVAQEVVSVAYSFSPPSLLLLLLLLFLLLSSSSPPSPHTSWQFLGRHL